MLFIWEFVAHAVLDQYIWEVGGIRWSALKSAAEKEGGLAFCGVQDWDVSTWAN